MDITVLREIQTVAVGALKIKNALVTGLAGKIEAIRLDGDRLLRERDRLAEKIEIYDEKLEAAQLASAETELQRTKDGIKQNADLLEATGKSLEKEKASIGELAERIENTTKQIRLAIADREIGAVKEFAFRVNRALEAARLAGSFSGYEDFFRRLFTVREEDRKTMRAEFENEAR